MTGTSVNGGPHPPGILDDMAGVSMCSSGTPGVKHSFIEVQHHVILSCTACP